MIHNINPPHHLPPSLWPHQLEALELIDEHAGAMLDLGMGCGKSRVIVERISREEIERTLVVCPKSVIDVWPREFQKYTRSAVRVLTLDKGTTETKAAELGAALRGHVPLVVVLNYESMWRKPLSKALVDAWFRLVVWDEIHRIKAAGGKASRYAHRLSKRIPRRVGLTGTMMPHSPLDVYAQFRALDWSIFGTSYTRFKARYAVWGGYEGRQVVDWQNLEEMRAKISSITLQVRRDVLDLVPATHSRRYCMMAAKTWKVYAELERDCIAELKAGTITAANAGVKLLRLRQVTSGHARDEDGRDHDVGDHKRKLLEEVLGDIAPDEPIVVFAVFRRDLQIIGETAKKLGRTSSELSGRANELAHWQSGGSTVLAVQIQAGGVGIDLTRARYCIYYSVGFSLGDYEQSLARIHRPGQQRHVSYIHLLARGTVDEAVYGALKKKQDIISQVLDHLGTRRAA